MQAIDAAFRATRIDGCNNKWGLFGPSGWSVSPPGEDIPAALALEEARDYVQIAAARKRLQILSVVAEADCVDARRILGETQRLDTNDDQLSRSADGIEKGATSASRFNF